MKKLEEIKVNDIEVGLRDVLKSFWEATGPQRYAMFFTLVACILVALLRLIVPLFYKDFFDILSLETNKELLVPELVRLISIILIIHIAIEALFRNLMWVMNDFESRTMARLKQMAFNYLIKHSQSFFANNFTGALVQRVNRFSRSFERLYDMLIFDLIPLVINVFGVMIIIYFQKPLISYIILAWIMTIFIFNFYFSRWKLKYDLVAAKADSTTTALLADSVTNQTAITLFTNYNKESSDFKNTSNEQSRVQRFTWNIGNVVNGVQGSLVVIIEFLIFYYAIKFWQKDLITIGTFVLFQVYILSIAHRLWDFGRIVRNLYEGFADSKEMVVILKTPHEIQDAPNATKLNINNGEIKFNNVNFNFNNENSLINDFSLSINGGDKIAFIGPSGAGKSTLVKLILRTYDVASGSITIDGQDIKEVSQESLHKNISFVPQEPVLFHRTLLENIRYGRPEASDEEVIKAAQLAHCDEFIDKLPLKYETMVGERGIKLSGGERQRVAIARAMLKNAPILVLDEATSSLDSHSEALIQDALDKLMVGKTTIVIAHRLSTIRKMDRIVVIEAGKVREDGNHDELLENKTSLYKKLWNLQAGGFIAG